MRGGTFAVAVSFVLLAACGSPQNEAGSPPQGSPPASSPPVVNEDAGGFRPASECEPFEPKVLPSGDSPGRAQPTPVDEPNSFMRSWGEGQDQVVVGWGKEVLDEAGTSADDFIPANFPSSQIVLSDGIERYVQPVGDPPLGQIAIKFVVDKCPYILWLAGGVTDDGETIPGFELTEAIAYARDF